MGSRRSTALVAVVVAIAVLGAGYLGWRRDDSADRRREELREQVDVEVPGARLVGESWRDEDHGRYIDTGGYDHRAGWTLVYELRAPVPVEVVAEAYVSALEARGWSVVDRDDATGRLTLQQGPEGRVRSVQVDCTVTMERVEADGTGDSPLRTATTAGTDRFTVTAELPFAEEPRYGG